MTLRPDYGLRMSNEGRDPRTVHHFYGLPLDGFGVVGKDRYTFAIEKVYDGERHCVSFDFGSDALEIILSAVPPRVASSIRRVLASDPGAAGSFRVDPVICEHVRATLGQLQESRDETFVPFVVMQLCIGSGTQR